MATPPPAPGPYSPRYGPPPVQPSPYTHPLPPQPPGPQPPPAWGYPHPAPPPHQTPPPQQTPPPHQPQTQPPQQPLRCLVCGGAPAIHDTVRGHQGLIVLMRFLRAEGAFCRTCGIATYRDMTARTLLAGWWGPLSCLITPVTVLLNLAPRARFGALPPPTGGWRPPLDPGKPLPARGPALLFLVTAALAVAAVLGLLVVGITSGGDEDPAGPPARPVALSVGDCVRNATGTWAKQDLRVVDCASDEAEYRVTRELLAEGDECADGEYYSNAGHASDGVSSVCLRALERPAPAA
ncbi:hypothetical protein GCM10027168_68080 [Streptomyces capparidis]